MYEALCTFCKTDVEPLVVLKDLLSRKAQIEQYDTIYSTYMETNPEGQGFTTTIVPGLAYKIKLLVFGAYYREDLYKHLKHDAKLKNSPEFSRYLEEQLQDERITEDSFCETTYLSTIYRILSAIYMTKYHYIGQKQQVLEFVPKPYPYKNPTSGELMYWKEEERKRKQEFDRKESTRLGPSSYPFYKSLDDLKDFEFEREGDLIVGKLHDLEDIYDPYASPGRGGIESSTFGKKPDIGKLYFQYVLFGSASMSKFEDISDSLYMHNYIKLPSAAFLFHTKIGPHEGLFNEKPGEFYKHDLGHVGGIVEGFVTAGDYEDCSKLYKKYRSKPSSFAFRYVCMILFLAVFEGLVLHDASMEELLAHPYDHLETAGDAWFPADNFYCMKWVLDSIDIDPDVVAQVKPIMDTSGGKLKRYTTAPQIQRYYAEAFAQLE